MANGLSGPMQGYPVDAQPAAVPGTFGALIQRAESIARRLGEEQDAVRDLVMQLAGPRPNPPQGGTAGAAPKAVPNGFIDRLNEIFDLTDALVDRLAETATHLRSKT